MISSLKVVFFFSCFSFFLFFFHSESSSVATINQNNNGVLQLQPMKLSGIRMSNKLSFRGKQKAEEYFHILDENGKGFLNFEDIRGKKYYILLICDFVNLEFIISF